MKYLGVAYAGVIGVVAAAAIYLLEAPNAGPLVVSADVDSSAASTNPAKTSDSVDAGAADPQATADITSALPDASTVSGTPRYSSQDESPLLAQEGVTALLPHENATADEAPKADQAGLEESLSESAEQAAPFQTASAGDFDYVGPPVAARKADAGTVPTSAIVSIPVSGPESRHEPLTDAQKTEQAKLEDDASSARDLASDSAPAKRTYLAYYVYAEHPPDRKPAELALDALKDVPVGTPLQEIKRAAVAFGLDYNFMKAVAKVESDFDPKQRTGSYIGLFQLSRYEFAKYGSGDILNARDNAMAAAYKFINDATQFEWDTHKNPTFSDMYLIHQQGWQGAAEHVSHPGWIAWKSMCATDEGKEKGEKWCKRAVWQNTLPDIKHMWKSVENLTSSAFVHMWRERIDRLYARYADLITGKQDADVSSQPSKPVESHCSKPKSCHSQPSGKSVSNKSLRQRVSHARRRLVPGGNARNVHAFISVGVHHS